MTDKAEGSESLGGCSPLHAPLKESHPPLLPRLLVSHTRTNSPCLHAFAQTSPLPQTSSKGLPSRFLPTLLGPTRMPPSGSLLPPCFRALLRHFCDTTFCRPRKQQVQSSGSRPVRCKNPLGSGGWGRVVLVDSQG